MTYGTALVRVLVPALLLVALPQYGKASDQPRNAARQEVGTIQRVAATAPEAAGSQVVIKDFKFDPKELTVPVGTKVTWTNKDNEGHTVTSNAGVFHSEPLDTNEQFSYVFKTPGTYPYHCKLHPQMTGQVIAK